MTPELYKEVVAEYRAYILSRITSALSALGISALGIGMMVWLALGSLAR